MAIVKILRNGQRMGKTARTLRDVTQIRIACVQLKDARDRLRQAGARKAANYVSRASKSAEGALRHARRMEGGR